MGAASSVVDTSARAAALEKEGGANPAATNKISRQATQWKVVYSSYMMHCYVQKTRNLIDNDHFSHVVCGAVLLCLQLIPAPMQLAQKFVEEGSLPSGGDANPDHVELRTVLEDPVGQKYIGVFAKAIHTTESFFAWTEIQEYRSIPTADYRRGMAVHIYQKYIKDHAVLQVYATQPIHMCVCVSQLWTSTMIYNALACLHAVVVSALKPLCLTQIGRSPTTSASGTCCIRSSTR
jgi:hypothetical protein